MMKKIIAFVCAMALLAAFGGIQVSAGMTPHDDNTVRIDSGFCNESEMIAWDLREESIVNFGNQNILRITPKDDPAFSDPEHPEYAVMSDFSQDGVYSDAPWLLIDSNPAKSRFVNVLIVESGVTQIGTYAFKGQDQMNTVTLYPTLTKVRVGAFSGCDGLTQVKFKGTREQWNAIVIEDDNEPLLSAAVSCIDDQHDYTPGDLDGDGEVTDSDAVYLLFYTFFPEDYPIEQPADYDGDGAITDSDAVYLLFYTFFPEDYPLS